MAKVLAALSGGVDSAAAAILLLEAGHEVAGAVLCMSPCHDKVVEAAKETAAQLGIPVFVKDCKKEFSEQIIAGFERAYLAGRTPNPCVLCNAEIKFPKLLELADAHGYELIATGHYAGISNGQWTMDNGQCGEIQPPPPPVTPPSEEGGIYIKKAKSAARDQSYMLYRLGPDVLSRLILPLAELEKDAVRALVKENGLTCHAAPDSSENCFLPNADYKRFIKERLVAIHGEKISEEIFSGPIISPEGEIIGQHNGLYNFTIGQRKGLGLEKSFPDPVFVRKLDPETNRVFLAWGGGEFAAEFEVGELVLHIAADWKGEIRFALDCDVKIRSAAKPARARVEILNQLTMDNGQWTMENVARVVFEERQRAIAPGQSAVFYIGDLVVGGGIIM